MKSIENTWTCLLLRNVCDEGCFFTCQLNHIFISSSRAFVRQQSDSTCDTYAYTIYVCISKGKIYINEVIYFWNKIASALDKFIKKLKAIYIEIISYSAMGKLRTERISLSGRNYIHWIMWKLNLVAQHWHRFAAIAKLRNLHWIANNSKKKMPYSRLNFNLNIVSKVVHTPPSPYTFLYSFCQAIV